MGISRHGREWRRRGHKSLRHAFKTNADFWVSKIEETVRRDKRHNAALRLMGWRVLRLWESTVMKNVPRAADRVRDFHEYQKGGNMRKGRATSIFLQGTNPLSGIGKPPASTPGSIVRNGGQFPMGSWWNGNPPHPPDAHLREPTIQKLTELATRHEARGAPILKTERDHKD